MSVLILVLFMLRLNRTCISYNRQHFLNLLHEGIALATDRLNQESKVVPHPSIALFIGARPYRCHFFWKIHHLSFP